MRVLIVDDDDFARTLLRNTLSTAGYAIECAADGRAAMEILCREHFQLVVSDWEMPGMNGLDLCRAIRALEPAPYTYVILLTSHDLPSERVEGLTAGADDFVAKPFNPDELLARVRAGERIQQSALAKRNELLKSEVQQRRRVEEALRQSVRRYRSLTEGSHVGIYHADAAGKIQYVNARWCELSGMTSEQAQGHGWTAAIYPDDRARVLSAMRAATGAATTFLEEYRFIHSDGRVNWVLGSAQAELNDAGELVAFVGTVTDITARIQAESDLRAHHAQIERINLDLSAKNARLAELYRTAQSFVEDVSHEFRTPLTVIKEYVAIVKDALVGTVTAEQKDCLDVVLNRTDDLSMLVDDLLDVSKLEAGMLRVCRRKHQVARIFETLQKTLERKSLACRVQLTTRLEADLPEVFCDAEKVGRIIINLVVNAIKFSREGDFVELSARYDDAQSQIVIGITDHGHGIPEQDVQNVLKRFKQLRNNKHDPSQGFGLGLNIATELVHLNLGEMQIESAVGVGSTFSFSLPVSEPEALMARWVTHVKKLRPTAAQAAVVRISVPKAVKSLRSDVEQFLQNAVRHSDFLLEAGHATWAWLVAVEPDELGKLLAALEQSRLEQNRNRPGLPIPPLDLEVKGAWPIHAIDLPALLKCVASPAERLEPCLI